MVCGALAGGDAGAAVGALVNHLPNGTVFTTDSGYQFGVISAEDIANATDVTTCAHGLANVNDCQKCSVAAMFHRQILRMTQWMQRQYGTDWPASAARKLADEKTREHCGFLPQIGPAPAEKDLPKLPPIKLSDVGLIVAPAPVEGNTGEIIIEIRRADAMEPDTVQRAMLDAIANGAAWVA